jgi:hypothetical protein
MTRITIADGWFRETMKRSYNSSKKIFLILVEKLDKGIILMKECAKMHKE